MQASVKMHGSQRPLRRGDGFGRTEAKDLLPGRREEVKNPTQNA
jgi:hypothetical protein